MIKLISMAKQVDVMHASSDGFSVSRWMWNIRSLVSHCGEIAIDT